MDIVKGNPSPREKSRSRIPRLQRSASFHGEAKKNSKPNEQEKITGKDSKEDRDDIGSLGSVYSLTSCTMSGTAYRKTVENPCNFEKGNTTKYAFHCSTPSTTGQQDEYLTPTQRANRTIRQLKSLLKESEENRNYKDFKIQRLTRELVELRFEHAQCEKIASGVEKEYDSATNLKAASLADSGHFEDLSYQTSQFKDSYAEKDAELLSYGGLTVEKNRHTITHLEKMDYLIKHHTDEMQEIRNRFTDRLESALTQLSDSNSRYANLLTNHDLTRGELEREKKENICLLQHTEKLEKKVVQLQNDIEEREILEYQNRKKKIIETESLIQELAEKNRVISELQSKFEKILVVTDSSDSSNNGQGNGFETQHLLSVVSTLEQQKKLKNSCCRKCLKLDSKDYTSPVDHQSADPCIILKFVRSAIFYLLTDIENGAEHLRAIQSILEFSPEERCAVERVGRHCYN